MKLQALNSSFCAAPADSKSRWPHGMRWPLGVPGSRGVSSSHQTTVAYCVLLSLVFFLVLQGKEVANQIRDEERGGKAKIMSIGKGGNLQTYAKIASKVSS